MLVIDDVLHLPDEPRIDLGKFIYALYAVPFLESLGDGEDAQVGRVCQLVVNIFEAGVVIAHKSVHTLTYHPEALLEHLLERTADGHNLTHRLHRRADPAAHAGELGEVPARNLADHIIQGRRYIGRIGRAHLTNLVEIVSESYLGRNEGKRITGGL